MEPNTHLPRNGIKQSSRFYIGSGNREDIHLKYLINKNLKIMKPIIFLFFIITINNACNNNDKNETPVEISIIDYSLSDTNCHWTNLENGKVIIVNDEAELKKHIDCEESLPIIDFSKYSLLLAIGGTSTGVHEINNTIFKDSLGKYTWRVAVRLNTAQVAQGWHAAIFVPKLTNKTTIVLEVQQSH